MKKTLVALAALLVATGAAIAGIAMATPGSGIVGGPIVARGIAGQDVVLGVPHTATVTRTVRVRMGKKVMSKRVRFSVQTVKPLISCGAAASCDLAFQQLTIAPGGHTGWHTHPGPTFVAVSQGEGTLYRDAAACPSQKYGPGTGFLQPSTEIHNFRNESSTNLTVFAFYMLPSGTANTAIRTDQAQPSACSSIP